MTIFRLSSLAACLAIGSVSALPLLEQRNALPSGCRYMSNSDFITMSDGEMQLILQYFNSQLNGQTVCSVSAQDSSVPWGCNLEKVKAGGFFGGLDSSGKDDGSDDSASGTSLDWNPDYVNAILHVPTLNQQADYGVQVPVVCLDSAQASVFFHSDNSACNYQNSIASGSTVDSGTSVALQIQQSNSVSYTYTTDTSILIAAGLSHTFSAGVPDVDSSSVSASLTVTVGYDVSRSDATVEQQTDALTITVTPSAGEKCWITLTSISCPGTAVINTPVTFLGSSSYGSAVAYNAFVEFPKNRPDYATYNGQNEYWVGDLGAILALNSSGQQFLTTEVTLAYSSTGTYSENCTSDGSAVTTSTSVSSSSSSIVTTPSTSATGSPGSTTTTAGTTTSSSSTGDYTPSISCPSSVAVINACNGVIADWTSQITTDSDSWPANNVTMTQSPAPGSPMTFGAQQITFKAVSGATGHSTTCTSVAQLVPMWAAEFYPQVDDVLYPSDGSKVKNQKYVIGYTGLCSAQRYGQCRLANVTSQDSSDFSWTQTSPGGAPLTVIDLSNGGQSWPSDDSLSFYLTCSDSYGNNGGAIVFQSAGLAAEVTTTIAAYTSTVTQQSTTVYLYTAVDTLFTVTSVPQKTATLHTATYYTSTHWDGTKYVTAIDATGTTKTVKRTKTMTYITSITQVVSMQAPASTVTISPFVQAHAVITKTSTSWATATTMRPRVTKTVTTSKTATHTGCTTLIVQKKHHEARDDVVQLDARAVTTGTATVQDVSHTLIVTDNSDTATVVNSGTVTSTDYTQQATVTGKANINWDMTDTAIVYVVLTTPLISILENYVATTTTTYTTSMTVVSAVSSTHTIAAPTRTVTKGAGLALTKTIWMDVVRTPTVTKGSTETMTTRVTKVVMAYTCTKTKGAHH